jgi:hypothetical protein
MTRYMYIETYTVSRSSVIIRSGGVAFNPVSGVAHRSYSMILYLASSYADLREARRYA